jgi:hypothetical protein
MLSYAAEPFRPLVSFVRPSTVIAHVELPLEPKLWIRAKIGLLAAAAAVALMLNESKIPSSTSIAPSNTLQFTLLRQIKDA